MFDANKNNYIICKVEIIHGTLNFLETSEINIKHGNPLKTIRVDNTKVQNFRNSFAWELKKKMA